MRQISVGATSNDVASRGRLWLVLVLPAVLVGVMTLSVWSDLRRFNVKAPFTEAHGTVAKLDCDNHGQYEVRFTAGAQTLTRAPGNLYLRARCQDLTLGETVRVWYSAQDSGYVSFIPPVEALSRIKGEIAQIIFIGYPLMAGFLFVALRFSRDNRRWPHKN